MGKIILCGGRGRLEDKKKMRTLWASENWNEYGDWPERGLQGLIRPSEEFRL